MTQPVSYLQTDPKWAGKDYSAKGEKTTIGASGCGPTSMAMVLATWADKSVTPETECAWALKNGFKCPHSGTYYGYFEPAGKRYGLTVTRLNYANIYGNSKHTAHALAKNALENGHLVIACMGKGNWTSSGHYVLCWKIEGNIIYINDPASKLSRRTKGDYSLFKSQVKYYWVIDKPKKEAAEDVELQEEKKGEEEEMITSEQLKTILTPEICRGIVKEGTEDAKVYQSLDEIPDGDIREAVGKLVEMEVIKGDKHGLGLTYEMARMLTFMYRLHKAE